MALIGTISGSNGTTTSSVTGSFIIAANPGDITPIRPEGVVLYVSGAATSIGADNPSILLKGDAFVSGAFGTDSYIQMKPVNELRIPTNTTASYIYTSGSTNDMYFTQYSGPYTNTTRLRWLESQIHTGLLHGGIISAATGGTTFSVTEGEGIIVTQNALTASSPYPTIIDVKWNAVVSQSLTYRSTNQITYLGVNASGNIFQQTTPISLTDDSSYISLGRVLHQTGSVVNGTVTMPIVSYGGTQYINDFVRAIGPLKASGHVLAASGSTLSLTKTSGVSYVQGRNYTVDPNSPDIVTEVTDTPVTVSKIFYQHVSGSTIIQNTGGAGAPGFTVIDPTKYVVGGVLTTIPAHNPNEYYTVQRVFWYPNSATRAFTVYYGNTTYTTLADAQAGITEETFTEGNNTVDAAILVAYILVQKDCTDLTNTSKAKIVQAGVFRGSGIGGGGGTASSTVPGGLDTYVQFNDGGSTFGGDAGLTYDKSTDTLTVAGDLAVNGGDITSTAAALNISAGTSGLAFQRSGTSFATFVSGASGPLQLVTLQASSGKSLVLAGGSGAGTQVTLSGSYIDIRSSNSGTPSGVDFSNDVGGNPSSYLNITSGTYVPLAATVSTNAAKIIAASSRDLVLGAPSAQKVFISGSTVTLNGGATGVSIQRDAAEILQVSSPGSPQVSITPGAGYTTANLFNITTTTLNVGGAATTVSIGASTGRTTLNANASISGSLTVTGSVAVNGGSITSTAASFNLANTTPTTVTIGDNAANLYLGKTGANRVFVQGNLLLNNNEIQASGGGTALTFPGGNTSALFAANVTVTGDVAVNGGDLTTNQATFNLLNGTATSIAFGGAATSMKIASGSGTAVEIGASTGRTTVYNDLVLGTGNVVVTNDATPISLVSSGNITLKLDVNNNGAGHRFDVQDYRGISQFFVGEDGNAEVSGTLAISGSTTLGTTVERMTSYQTTGSVIAFDTTFNSIFYVNNPNADITANFTNVPTTNNNRILTPTVILSQSATPRTVTAVQVNGTGSSILWANSTTPTASANKQDVFGFSLIRSGSIWTVLGQLSTYG